ncbi:MAG: ATPase [Micrococcales bacterium 73-15]|mgnify:CR=1 FL=1|uniref:xylulokinase n=1 Tax=Salana multivorans TaxID=120377 RepID=UPI00095AE42C|nr:FGGY-family carbohydrate kinase [Salana multivorans]OJX93947.1 MAG: ATPase [Micrococcales bacterium 73-15]
MSDTPAAHALASGTAVLGIELGSTRIKACLLTPGTSAEPHAVIATGSHAWENQFVDRLWTYPIDDVWTGLRAAVADLLADAELRHGIRPSGLGAVGVSAMMHGYLAFDAAGELLVPFRTWRNTNTEAAARELTDLLDHNVPLRWSIAHYAQAVRDAEPHVSDVAFLTTLSGYVHWRLTGEKVLGVGDASGMFPIDPDTGTYDAGRLALLDRHLAEAAPGAPAPSSLLPTVLRAGEAAGSLTAEGAALLDPTGAIAPGVRLCPPEGDAGTGMVATNAVTRRTGNVSVGTSIFAMIVLERPLAAVHHEIDLVTTPAGDLVAMVHCNNGASELGEWAGVFGQFAAALGHETADDDVFGVLLRAALDGEADGGGLLAYNYLSGEPVTGLAEGRPLVVRTPDSRLTLANLMRAQVYGVFGTLSLGMRILEAEGAGVDRLLAHGGVFRTAGVAQRFLAAAVGTPVAVGETASEGGAWGIAILADYLLARADAPGLSLADYLDERVFAGADVVVVDPDPDDVAGYARYLATYEAGLAVERAAGDAL